jgi:hypothetical protein
VESSWKNPQAVNWTLRWNSWSENSWSWKTQKYAMTSAQSTSKYILHTQNPLSTHQHVHRISTLYTNIQTTSQFRTLIDQRSLCRIGRSNLMNARQTLTCLSFRLITYWVVNIYSFTRGRCWVNKFLKSISNWPYGDTVKTTIIKITITLFIFVLQCNVWNAQVWYFLIRKNRR